jgi:thiol-disulfide isomerase/thioredoxin
MRRAHPLLLCAALIAAYPAARAATAPTHEANSAPAAGPGQVAWIDAAGDADVDKAFALGRAQNKPVLVYWGAQWCPPCNQLKATLFNRQDFIERSNGFVAVHVDGDLPGAQKLGTRFKVRGYPTLILFGTQGTEITRLPGEADAPQVMSVLEQGMSGGRPVRQVLADGRAGKALTASEWRMLAFYSWDTDESQLLTDAERPGVLAQLAASCPAADTDSGTRLLLKAVADSDDGKGIKPDAALRERVLKLLAEPAATRAQMDIVVNYAPDLTRALEPERGAGRNRMAAAFDTALSRRQADPTLSRADRVSALFARVDLARIDQPKDALRPKLSPALLKEVRDEAARQDREITNGYERQAVITEASQLLAEAGLWAESDALLRANLSKSHSPYYLMSELASNARKQGRDADALRWYQQAFDTSQGPATRLQWGASYLNALVDLSPNDAADIEKTATQLLKEASGQPNAFYERSARSLQRVGSKLTSWNEGGKHQPVIDRLQGQLDGVCGRLGPTDPQKATCAGLLKATKKAA